jgi:hypothetical protein
MTSWTWSGLTHVVIRTSNGRHRTACEAGSPRAPDDVGVWVIVGSLTEAIATKESRTPTCLWCTAEACKRSWRLI